MDFADILDEAIALSGGEERTAEEIISARRSAYLLLQKWQQLNYNTWRVKQVRISLDGSAERYVLPRDVDDLLDVRASANVVTGTTKVDSWSPITRISRGDYYRLTNHQTYGQPSQIWLDRTDPPAVHPYPIGIKGQQIQLVYVERPKDFDPIGNAFDAPDRWTLALVTGIAASMSKKRIPIDVNRVDMLMRDYTEAETLAVGDDRERVNFRLRV